MDISKAIKELDKALLKKKLSYTLYICGGAQLVFLGYNTRRTEDVDLILEVIDPDLQTAAEEVAKKLKLEKNWLNNKVFPIGKRLGKGWKKTAIPLFEGKAIIVMGLNRQNLINAKLHAAVERKGEDYQDLLFLKPSLSEIHLAEKYALKQKKDQETSAIFVRAWVKELINDLGLD